MNLSAGLSDEQVPEGGDADRVRGGGDGQEEGWQAQAAAPPQVLHHNAVPSTLSINPVDVDHFLSDNIPYSRTEKLILVFNQQRFLLGRPA